MAFKHIILNLLFALTLLTQATPYPTNTPELSYAGISLPDTPSVQASLEFINQYLDEPTIYHVIRSTLFALLTRSKAIANDPTSPLATSDAELIAVATLLHDMSWNVSQGPAHQFVSPDKRFEVDGANVARDFLSQLGNSSTNASGWDQHRLQVVWDAIALHTTLTIGQYKEPEVVLSGYGIYLDVVGYSDQPLQGIPSAYRVTEEEYNRVYAALPDPDFVVYVRGIGIGLCVEKPATTYDNIIASVGEQWVDGYSLEGKLFADLLIARAQREGIQNFTGKVDS